MSIVRTYFTVNGQRYPWFFNVDDNLWDLVSSAGTIYSGRAESVADVQNKIAELFGDEVLNNAIPITHTGGTRWESTMSTVKSIFPNAFDVEWAGVTGSGTYVYNDMLFGESPFKISQTTSYDSANSYYSGSIGHFLPPSVSGAGGSCILGARVGINERYNGEINITFQVVLPTMYYTNGVIHDIPNSVSKGISIRYYSLSGSTPNFWIYGRQTISNNSYFNGLVTPEWPDTPQDPYGPGGESGPGGGTGTFSDTGDIIGVPSLPTLSAVDTGFISLFNPSAGQIKALANYMWSNSFDISTFKNIVANPIECILGLTIVPVNPPNAGVKTLTVGNIATDVSMPYLSSQYVEVDCGTLNVVEFWGSYLDYSPYTKLSLYLPYIGIVPIDIDDAQNSTIKVVYHVDVLSGACVAYVLCGGTQLYTYIGQCSSNIPVTSNDFTNTVNGILGIAGNIGTLVSDVASAKSSPAGGMAIAGSAISAVANMASNAIDAFKPNIQKSGSISGTGGMLGVQTPYLICQRPRQSVPARQNTFTGYPSNITAVLGDLIGYTEISSIHLNNIPATDEELTEIESLLKGGVLI